METAMETSLLDERTRSIYRRFAGITACVLASVLAACGGGSAPELQTAADRDSALSAGMTGAAAMIDADERRTAPVPHRYVHGSLGDAKFQIVLPEAWNGKFLMGTRGFSGNEFSAGAFVTTGLAKGYAYALSDEGWSRQTIVDQPEDKYYESRRRIVQLTHYAKQLIQRHYGQNASRTYLAGSSNGGHHTKWLVEDYPSLYDGGLSGFGYNSALEEFRGMAVFLRNYLVLAARINDIIAARTADPAWDPNTTPLSPPLAPAELEALNNIYSIPAQVSGLVYNVGRAPGSEFMWPANYAVVLAYLIDSLEKFDPTYDPDGDGQLSVDEIHAWDPYTSPRNIQNELRKLDLTGNLQRPVIVGQGTYDVLVSPYEADGYKRLVEQRLGADQARDVLALYYIPGMGHGGAPFNAFIAPALDALDQWVDYVQSSGALGQPPPSMLGGYPRE
jgi:hypothetical protein